MRLVIGRLKKDIFIHFYHESNLPDLLQHNTKKRTANSLDEYLLYAQTAHITLFNHKSVRLNIRGGFILLLTRVMLGLVEERLLI